MYTFMQRKNGGFQIQIASTYTVPFFLLLVYIVYRIIHHHLYPLDLFPTPDTKPVFFFFGRFLQYAVYYGNIPYRKVVPVPYIYQ
ncbi:pC84L [African swine fever virus]|uniref:PC84L n=1 Tax=African swine fever virus TaxID=10497 RepID=A0A894KS83_ASF|nr:pC84L [African swine fever virus]